MMKKYLLHITLVALVFTLTPALASAAPSISSISVLNIGPTSTTVTWTTNAPSTSQIEYGLTASYGSHTRKDMRLVTAHSLPLVGLSQSTLHHFRVLSDDSAGLTAVSGERTFTTLPPVACAPAPTDAQILDVRSYGATGNGSTDDTVAIQNAINAVVSGGTVLVPAGTYMMNTNRIPGTNVALGLKSNMTFKMAPGAVLKAIPSNSKIYHVIMLWNVRNISVVGGTILGERSQHIGTEGEAGMGISIYSGQNITVDGVTAKDLWGDGFYIDQTGSGASEKSTGITFCNVVADNNRRQGMSIVWVEGMSVRDSVFKNTNGHSPERGIDIEPNLGTAANNVTITGSQFLDNASGGIVVSGNAADTLLANITISNNFVRHKYGGIELYKVRGGATISGNIIQPGVDAAHGILVAKTINSTVSDNSIINAATDGILLGIDSNSNTVKGNYVEGSSQATNGVYSNIRLVEGGTTKSNANVIKCNVLRAGAQANKPRYGISVLTNGVTNTQLLTNNVYSGTAGTINDNGTNTIISSDPANCPSTPPLPDTTPPIVSVTAPENGTTVSGSAVAVSANASDNVGVAGVQFKRDGANLGAEDTTAPYSVTGDSTLTANGTHILTAVARDAAGNVTTSTGVSVTVNNASSPTYNNTHFTQLVTD